MGTGSGVLTSGILMPTKGEEPLPLTDHELVPDLDLLTLSWDA